MTTAFQPNTFQNNSFQITLSGNIIDAFLTLTSIGNTAQNIIGNEYSSISLSVSGSFQGIGNNVAQAALTCAVISSLDNSATNNINSVLTLAAISTITDSAIATFIAQLNLNTSINVTYETLANIFGNVGLAVLARFAQTYEGEIIRIVREIILKGKFANIYLEGKQSEINFK